MSFRAGSNAREVSTEQRKARKFWAGGYGKLWLYPVVFNHFYGTLWKTKDPACTEQQEDGSMENLLSFVVMKENGHKAHRSVQFTALLKQNSCRLQLTGCNSDPRGWSEGVKQM